MYELTLMTSSASQGKALKTTDASSKQLGAVITQKNRPIAFFSRKLSGAQCKYSVTKIELLAIVKTLKEFKKDAMGPTYQSVY